MSTVTSTRILDTRTGLGGARRLAPGATIRVDVSGPSDLPDSANAAVMNVTAVDPAARGYVQVTPCRANGTATSTVNFPAGRTIANSTIATLDADGTVCVAANVATDVVIDVTGWLGPNGESALRPRTAERVVDTRLGLGVSSRLVAGRPTRIDLADVVEHDATAVAANLTATGARRNGYLTASACDAPATTTSSLNFGAGESRANNAVVALSARREICVRSNVDVDLVIDVTGTFASSGLTYAPATPTRLLDTRRTRQFVAGGAATSFVVPPPPAPSPVAAASVNLTAVDHRDTGFVTSWDCGPRRTTSALNMRPGEANANGAIAPVTANGRSCLYAHTATHLVVDLTGWWL